MGTTEQNRINGPKGGRPIGSGSKPKVVDYVTPKQLTVLAASTLKRALDGDSYLAKFLLEQHWGKSHQSIDTTINFPQFLSGLISSEQLTRPPETLLKGKDVVDGTSEAKDA